MGLFGKFVSIYNNYREQVIIFIIGIIFHSTLHFHKVKVSVPVKFFPFSVRTKKIMSNSKSCYKLCMKLS